MTRILMVAALSFFYASPLLAQTQDITAACQERGHEENFCACAVDKVLPSVLEKQAEQVESQIENKAENIKKQREVLLQDPAMNISRINKICAVVFDYQDAMQKYPHNPRTGGVVVQGLTLQQKQQIQRARRNMRSKIDQLHQQFGSREDTYHRLGSSHGLCKQAYEKQQLEEQLERIKAGDWKATNLPARTLFNKMRAQALKVCEY